MGKVESILVRAEKISRQQMRSETAGGGRSTDYAKFRKLAIELKPGGDAVKISELVESEVSSIRTQVNYLNDEDADEKEFVVTRRKMKDRVGDDVTNEDGKKLYNLYIYRNKVRAASSDTDSTGVGLTEDEKESGNLASYENGKAGRENNSLSEQEKQSGSEDETDEFERLFAS